MKKRFSTLGRIAAATMGALAFLAVDASAQTGNFENTTAGAVYQVGSNGGVLRLRCSTSTVSNNAGTNNIGTSGNPVPGIVEYGRTTADAQSVAALYYTNLMMSGASSKTIPDGVYVMGNGYGSPLGGAPLYASMSTGNGYFAAGGDRSYTGTFHYGSDDAQNVFAEGETAGIVNNYDKLDLYGATNKTIQFVAGANNGRVVVRNDIQLAASTELRVYDDLSYNTTGATASLFSGAVVVADATTTEAIQMRSGGANATFSSTVAINPNGDFAVAGTGNVTLNGATTVNGNDNVGGTTYGRIQVADGAAGDLVVTSSLTIDDGTATDGQLYLGTGGTTLQITGTLENQVTCAERSNVTFADASTVIYDNPATQVVMGTLQSHNYANLTIGGAGNKTADCDIYMRNDLAMAGTANLFLTPDVATVGFTLYRDVTGHAAGQDVTYAVTNNTQHIQGNMKLIGTMVSGRDYTLNNAHTKVRFGADVPTTEFGFRVIPGVALNTLNRSDIDAQIELPRMVRVLWTGGTPLVTALEMGYTDAELAAAPTTLARESKIKFFEGYNNAEPKVKINGLTGTTYARDEAANWVRQNYGGVGVTLVASGVNAGGINSDIASNSDIILGAGAVQTIANGRWSDPATWDEGVMPAFDDDAIVRHAVWTGNDVAQFGANAYVNPERDYNTGAAGASARNVTIIAVAPGFTNPGLVIDGADTDYANNYKFGITGDLTNLNTNVMSSDPTSTLGDLAGTAATSIQGLWVRPINTTTQNVISVGGIINHGGVMNKGIIEICNQ